MHSGLCKHTRFASILFTGNELLKTNNLKNQVILKASTCAKLSFTKFGNPNDVLKLNREPVNLPNANEVLVKMTLAPVSSGDISIIQGLHGVKPNLPAVPGMEGVGVVEEVGSNVKSLAPGDRVVFDTMKCGTWGTHVTYPEENVIKVRNDVDFLELCTISNIFCAYRMLKDFVHLKPGDTVIQNGGNGALGQFVIQLCKIWGINTINVVRHRPDINIITEHLLRSGATHVVTDKDIRNFEIKNIPRPVLALNCIGGLMAKHLFRFLSKNAVFVTYGSLSKEPVPATISAMMYKDITFKGFWLIHWYKKHRRNVNELMLNEVMGYMKEKKLISNKPYQLLPLLDFKVAIDNISNPQGFVEKKFAFDMRE